MAKKATAKKQAKKAPSKKAASKTPTKKAQSKKASPKNAKAKKAPAKKQDPKFPTKPWGDVGRIPVFLIRSVKGKRADLRSHDGILYKVTEDGWFYAENDKPVPKTKVPKI